jgi:hypothetical protein
VLIVYKNWFVDVTPGRSSASFQHIKLFVETNTKVILTKKLLHVNVCKSWVTMLPLLCCSSRCVLLYPSGTPNPDTMYTILRYTIRLYGKKHIVEVQNRIFGQGYTCLNGKCLCVSSREFTVTRKAETDFTKWPALTPTSGN